MPSRRHPTAPVTYTRAVCWQTLWEASCQPAGARRRTRARSCHASVTVGDGLHSVQGLLPAARLQRGVGGLSLPLLLGGRGDPALLEDERLEHRGVGDLAKERARWGGGGGMKEA